MAILLAGSSQVAAQRATVQGIVISTSSGGPLEGVMVALDTAGAQAYGALTDRNGFYQIGRVRPGSYALRAQLIGHQQHEQMLTLAADEHASHSFRMSPDPVQLEGLVVAAAPTGAAVRELSRQVVRPADIRRVPVPAGTGDLASYLQTLPGVTSTGDRGGQVFVRGGTPAENLVLVDGIPIYQPFHILGFFSVFPETLVSSVDFYAGGFGARYHDRTASVLDVHLRDGRPGRTRVLASASPFIAEAVAEGAPLPGLQWLASARRSLVEETSGALLGSTQPLTFESQLLKITGIDGENRRCSVLALRTADEGRLDPEERESRMAWENSLVGGRCLTQLTGFLRLLDVNFSYTSTSNTAVSREASAFKSRVRRMQHDAHLTSMFGSVPIYAGYETYVEVVDYDLSELFGVQASDFSVFGASTYLEVDPPLSSRLEVRPGVVFSMLPQTSLQPRVRASYRPWGRASEQLNAAVGLYEQNLLGTSDTRDVSSVFVAWMAAPDGAPLRARHALLGWQQSLGDRLRWSVEGYYKDMENIPVPTWTGLAEYTTKLTRADGQVHGADARVEFTSPHYYGLLGYGYTWTRYHASPEQFGNWFGKPIEYYHPLHDRRHQLNALASVELGGFKAAARWQLGSGLPFTRPIGFAEVFDFSHAYHRVSKGIGSTRLVLERPYAGRLPAIHRLDVSLERAFEFGAGQLKLQGGVVNAYDQQNIFYYDLYTGRRSDQLPLAPYAAVTFQSR